jgi:uncharacterized protein (DUF169 family)
VLVGFSSLELGQDLIVANLDNDVKVWSGCQDHEMIMDVPGDKLPELFEGLEKKHIT